MYVYRNHITSGLKKLRFTGIFLYLPNQTELGKKYSCFYDNNRWLDQKNDELDYRLYFSLEPRPIIGLRTLIRFPKKFIPFILEDSLTGGYFFSSKESFRIVAANEIEVYSSDEWINLINLFFE